MFTLYIGYDSSNYGQELAFEVCKRSVLKFNKDIKIIKLENNLKEKNIYRRENDMDGSTEFTYTRFLVPYLNNYKDFAIFVILILYGDVILMKYLNILIQTNQ